MKVRRPGRKLGSLQYPGDGCPEQPARKIRDADRGALGVFRVIRYYASGTPYGDRVNVVPMWISPGKTEEEWQIVPLSDLFMAIGARVAPVSITLPALFRLMQRECGRNGSRWMSRDGEADRVGM
jgi:hypothetical protein